MINGQETSNLKRLHDKLFSPSNYNKNHEPNGLIGPNGTTGLNKTVQFGIALIHLDVLEKESIMYTDLWLRFVWNEPKFVWNEEDYGGISVLRVSSDTIWKPDIMLYNK